MIDVEFDDVYCDESMNDPRLPGKVSFCFFFLLIVYQEGREEKEKRKKLL